MSMSTQRAVLEAIRGMIDAQGSFAPVMMGTLPAEDGLSMAASAGREVETTLAQERTLRLDVVVSARHREQAAALDALCRIHEGLAIAALPSGAGWQVTGIRTGSAPALVGLEGSQWLYGSALEVTYAEWQ